MVDISRGTPERVQEEVETENLSPAQREAAVKTVLDEFDAECSNVRYSQGKSIEEEYADILDAYVARVLDLME